MKKTKPFVMFILISVISISILSCSSNEQKFDAVNNLAVFAKLYGCIKYYHPSDEASAIDWNLFAIQGAKEVVEASDREELIITLNRLFQPIAPSVQIIDSAGVFSVSQVNDYGHDTVRWQHLGIGFNRGIGLYRDVRINRKTLVQPYDGRGVFSLALDKFQLNGSRIKLALDVKAYATNVKSYTYTYIRGKSGMDDKIFASKNYPNSPKWTHFEDEVDIPLDATALTLDLRMRDVGSFIFDNIRLYKLIGENQWEQFYGEDFEKQKIGESWPELISINGLYDKMEEEALYENVITSAGSHGRALLLKSDSVYVDSQPLFPIPANNKDTFTINILGIKALIPLALSADSVHTFPIADPQKLKDLLEKLSSYSSDQMSGDDLYVRLGDVINAWNVFEHFYPYFEEVGVDWTLALKEALSRCFKDHSSEDFKNTLAWMLAQLKDGHGYVSYSGTESFFPPLKLEYVNNQIMIVDVFGDSVNIKKGSILNQIDREAAEVLFERNEIYESGATEGYRNLKTCLSLLKGEKGSTVELELQYRDSSYHVSVPRSVTLGDLFNNHYMVSNWRVEKEKISRNIMYLNLTRLSGEEVLNQVLAAGEDTIFIMDLRGYPAGRITPLLGHLLSSNDTSSRWMKIPEMSYPYEISGYDEAGWNLDSKSPHVENQIYLLTNAAAISYSESLISMIKHYKLATIVGQSTAGTNGNVNPFLLPGKYAIVWTGMKVIQHDGSPLFGVGIKPDVYIEPTVRGIQEGKDEILEKAIELARKEL